MRKLRLAAAVSLVLASNGAFGLGLGDIEMRSALNQPMNAEIRLTSVKPGELDGMIVTLASPDAFARAGIERSQSLQDLRFAVDESGQVPVIRITSTGPVVEPFLNFLLEVDWPQGRMVREYTVLLDPPVFLSPSSTSGGSAIGDSPALTNRNDNALVAPAPIERPDANTADAAGRFDVELVGADSEIGNDATFDGTNPLSSDGEVVSLDGLGSPADSDLLAPEGEVVALTDLDAPNLAAEQARDAAAQSAEDYNFEVEVVGTAEEIGNEVPGSEDGVQFGSVAGSGATDGEVVSLDGLDLDAIGTDTVAANTGTAGDRTVQRGETLYEIAEGMASDGVTVQQMMLALLSANEAAFIDGNINLVRAGAILRVPDATQLRNRSQAEAVAEVASQNQLWQEYRDNIRQGQGTRIAADARDDANQTASADTAGADDIAEASTEEAEPVERDVLSADARAILEQARQEILQRDELRIVGEDTSSSAVANAGESREGAGTVAAIDERLQLAREELSSTRLESRDLDDQAGELRNTTENLDALVSLRQNEIAALEQRLADARTSTGDAAGNAADTAAGLVAGAGDAASNAANSAGNAAGNAVDSAGNAVNNAADSAGNAAGNLADSAGDAAGNAVDTTRNALTDTGQELGSVELVDGSNAADAAGNAAQTAAQNAQQAGSDAAEEARASAEAAANAAQADQPWYQSLMSDPRKLGIAGVGALALLGALGTLLWRRRKSDDAMLDFDEDDVEFLDEDGFAIDSNNVVSSPAGKASGKSAVSVTSKVSDKIGAGGAAMAAAGAAGMAGVAGAASRFGGGDQSADGAAFDDTIDAGAVQAEALDNDDTISEIDVYLAYGLHGQAEELLTDAIASDPNNPVYPRKLLETYHAQGNSEGFVRVANDYHERFGGENAPHWDEVVNMGHELRPQDPLFADGEGAVASMAGAAATGLDSDRMNDDDFAESAGLSSGNSSVGRDFGDSKDSDEVLDFGSDDETDLMDQSLDPAFAFDEGDLEATGDFSQIASEVAAESEDGVIEFATFDEPAAPKTPKAPVAAAMDGIDAPDLDAFDLSASATAANDRMDHVASTVSDDLTLDLDQLSGDLAADGTQLIDSNDLGSVDALEIPDLTADNDLLSDDGFDAGGDDADEMDTMLDLAKAYIDMGDRDSASNALGEIVKSGSPDQVVEAETLLRKIS